MNALESRQKELADLTEYLSLHPEWRETYHRAKAEMDDFNRKVNQVLESKFQLKHYRPIIAILNSIETGNLDYIFNAWLNELVELGLLGVEDA